MAPLSNAERQRLYRERLKVRLHGDPSQVERLHAEIASLRATIAALRKAKAVQLTPGQEEERAVIIADLLSDRSWSRVPRKRPPKFMGWTREGWLTAPSELLDYFGLREARNVAAHNLQDDVHKDFDRRGRRPDAAIQFTNPRSRNRKAPTDDPA